MAKSDVTRYKFVRDRIKGYIRYKAKITCPKCKKTRWVLRSNIYISKNFTELCQSCNGRSGAENGMWKGGLIQTGNGYMQRLLKRGDKYYDMATKTGYVLEHRYVVAKRLGRPLKKYEVVHHLNGIKDDNRNKNLELLVNKTKHLWITRMQTRIRELENQVIKMGGAI